MITRTKLTVVMMMICIASMQANDQRASSLASLVAHGSGALDLWGHLEKGPYGVGFRSMNRLDSTRKSPTFMEGRPLQISIWYPAQRDTSRTRMKYKNYFSLSTIELSAKTLSDSEQAAAIEKYKQMVLSAGVEANAFDTWMNGLMKAVRNAPPVAGTFPLVLIAQGNFHSAHHQAILAEYLASHGYVAATVPSQTRISGPMQREEDALASAEEQMDDLNFLLQFMSRQLQVDAQRLALIGHSFGGRSTLLLTERGVRATALLSLDGGAGLKSALGMIRQASYFDPASMKIPFLHCYQDSDASVFPDLTLIHSFDNSDRFIVKFSGTNHFFFTSLGMAAGSIPGFNGLTGTKCQPKYEALCQYSLRFLDAYVKKSNASARYLESPVTTNGLESNDIVVDHRKPVASAK